ncbi:MAG: flippase [Candidatus Rokubacteria bacterium]|nr:flippase [Candidatus Rokubacteria bacterium]
MIDRVIARNVASRLLAKILSYGLGLTASVMLVRYLGVERLGQFHYASTFASLFGLLASLGLPILLTRDAARDKTSAGSALGAVMVLQGALSLLSLVLIVVSGVLFNPPELALPIAILGVGVAVHALATPSVAVLNAFERMDISAAIDVGGTLLRVALILVAIRLGLDLVGLVLVLALSPIAYLVATRLAADRCATRPRIDVNVARLRALLVSTVPFALMVVFNNLYFRIDIIMLEKMRGDAAVGVYSAAYKFVDALLLIGSNIAGVLYPRMAALSGPDPRELRRTVETAFRFMAALGVPSASAMTILAPWLVPSLFGEGFGASVLALQVLIWAIALMFMYMPLVHCLNAIGREWQWVLVLILNTAINIGLNFVLIPWYGTVGAAASTVLCEGAGLVLVAWVVRRVGPVGYVRTLARVLVASALMSVVLSSFHEIGVVTAVTLAAATYVGALYGLRILTVQERTALLGWFRSLGAHGVAR